MTATNAWRFQIRAIPHTGKEVKLEVGWEWFAPWVEDDPALGFAVQALKGDITLARHAQEVLVRGHLQAQLELTCSRCLKIFVQPAAADFDLLLAPAPGPAGPAEEELSAADLDQDYYTGDTLDLEPIIREQVVLLAPAKPLCAEACRGLCPRCGVDLNEAACGCRESAGESPLAALAKLKV